jgi:CRISPR-associated protein Cas2
MGHEASTPHALASISLHPFSMRNTFLVCYDICEEKRLRTVFKTMRDFGDHLQYSIFECQFTETDLVRCRHALSEIINHREDQVLFVDLGPVEGRGERVITALGKPYISIDSPCIVVDGGEG